MGIVEFLRARYDERAQKARAAMPGPWYVDDDQLAEGGWIVMGQPKPGWADAIVNAGHDDGGIGTLADAEFIADNDPAWVLADVAAKRRILDWLEEDARFDMPAAKAQAASREEWYLITVARTTIKLMALPYASHPDYDPAWSPT